MSTSSSSSSSWSSTSTLNPPRTRSFWGWGHIEQHNALTDTTHMFTPLIENAESLLGNGSNDETPKFYVKAPVADEIILSKPRFELTQEMNKICSCDHYLRLTHTHGKSYDDIMRGLARDFADAPDYVAQPYDEDEIKIVLKFASERRIAIVPYGGGSSVVMGVSAPSPSSGYIGWISLSMIHFNRLISVDTVSRSICVEAGMYGPALEAALKPYGLSCRHYPQSFEFSTVGGWVATRSAGHFATGLTHIDEYVQSIRAIIPNTSINNGVYETRPLPASGAGIDPNRIMIGSEGILGVITRVHLRVQQRPCYRAAETVYFKEFMSQAVPAVREIAQSGLLPSNCRLVDASESMTMGLSTDGSVALLLAFESHIISDFTSQMRIIMEICKRHGGYLKKKKQHDNNNNNNMNIPETSQSSHGAREGGAGAWRDNFIAVPYLRDIALQHGLIVETFETACTWSAFPALYDAINHACMNAIKKHCHGKGMITCRFTHVYPDGPAPYFSIAAIGHGTLQDRMQQWAYIKHAASQVLVDYQGTASHHHAVGKYHQPYYKQEMPVAYLEGLRSLKSRLDPSWILNPEVLLDVPKLQSKL